MNKKIILISGASGLVGSELSTLFSEQGFEVRRLSSNKRWVKSNQDAFYWNVGQNYIDPNALKDVDFLINLSGASIADGLWTKKRKKIIHESRIDGTKLLFESFQKQEIKLSTYFGASAVGYYGSGRQGDLFDENSPKGFGFLSDVCDLWELQHNNFKDISEKVVIGRVSNVISSKGGFLLPFMKLSGFGLKLMMGNQQCYCSWIHIEDLIRIISGIENIGLNGTYNLCAGHSDWNEFQNEFYKQAGHQLIKLTIPTSLLKFLMGEMSSLIIDGNRVTGEKVVQSGFEFKYSSLSKTFNNINFN